MDYDNWLEEMELRNLEYEEQKAENDRKHQVSLIRMDTPCYFQDGFSHQEFAARAHNVLDADMRIGFPAIATIAKSLGERFYDSFFDSLLITHLLFSFFIL